MKKVLKVCYSTIHIWMGEAISLKGVGGGVMPGGWGGEWSKQVGFFFPPHWLLLYCIEGLLQTFPFARTARGHSGFFGSKRGIAVSEGFSIWPFQGLFMRCGETRIHSPRRGLYLVCWYSVGSKIPGFIWSQKSAIIAFLMAEPRTVLYTGQWFLVFAHAVLSVRSPPLLAKMAVVTSFTPAYSLHRYALPSLTPDLMHIHHHSASFTILQHHSTSFTIVHHRPPSFNLVHHRSTSFTIVQPRPPSFTIV